MKLTKHEHAYMSLEEDGQKLLIDPGAVTTELGDISNVIAVVVTHSHFDHLNIEHLAAIAAQNPQVVFYSTDTVAQLAKSLPVKVVVAGQTVQAGPFSLRFFGEKHALIHDTNPDEPNVGLLVNDSFYYPGDSLTEPGVSVKTLAVPVSGPWLKTGEAMDFVEHIAAQLVVPAHDALLSPLGQKISEAYLTSACEISGGRYQHLAVGATIEL